MAAPTVRDVTSVSAVTGTDQPSVTAPATTQVGDLLIAVTLSTQIVDHTALGSWNLIQSTVVDSSVDQCLSSAWFIATTAGAQSYNPVDIGASGGSFIAILVIEAGTFDSAFPIESSTETNDLGIPPDPTLDLFDSGDHLSVAIGAWRFSSSVTNTVGAPSGYTLQTSYTAAAVADLAVATKALSASNSEDPGAFTDNQTCVSSTAHTVIVAETTLATKAGTDAPTLSISETSTLAASATITDAPTLSITETASLVIINSVAASDTPTVSITDTSSVVVLTEIAGTDAPTLSITETASVVAIVATSDTLSVSISDDANAVTPFTTPSEVYTFMSATIREAASTTSDPQAEILRLDGTSSAELRALVNVARTVPIGVGASVIRADLILTQAEAASGSYTLTAEPLNGTWDAATVTWATAPSVRAETATTTVASGGSDGTQVTLDLTSILANSVAEDDATGDRWYGVRLKKSTAGSHKFYSSFTDITTKPKLDIEWSIPPLAPEDLQPNNDQAVSEVKPELVFRFTDLDAEDTLAFVEVEIDTDDTFETPTYDSGQIAHNVPRFDLASPPAGAPATPTLVAGTTYYWRAKATDNHGQVSPWSATASFVVTAKGTLTLTSPSGSSVTSPTPTATWTLTSATQSQYEVEWERKVGGVWVSHYLSPWQVGAATSHTLPDAHRLQEGQDYRVSVRATDSTDRADMAGDRRYYEDSQEVTLAALT